MSPRPLLPLLCALPVVFACSNNNASKGQRAAASSSAQVRRTAPSGSARAATSAIPSPSASIASLPAPPEGPLISTREKKSWIYDRPRMDGNKIGYLRVGTLVSRSAEPVKGSGCPGKWWTVKPRGFICEGFEGVTTNLKDPYVAAASSYPPKRNEPLPYGYATTWGMPLYLKIPTKEQQRKLEGNLEARAASLERLRMRMSERKRWPKLGMTIGPTPPFLLNGGSTPYISEQKFKDGAVTSGNAWNGMRLSLLTAFHEEGRDFYLTTEHFIVPAERMRPAKLADFRGVQLAPPGEPGEHLPMVWVNYKPAKIYRLTPDGAAPTSMDLEPQDHAEVTKEDQIIGGKRFFQLVSPPKGAKDPNAKYLIASGSAHKQEAATEVPIGVNAGETWIDIAIGRQTLVLYRGLTPIFVTLVSTGVDGAGDPVTTRSSPRGTFRIKTKHITTRMAGDEKPPQKEGEEADPRYRIDDVPYVQFFHAGYALHGAFWHDAFGQAKSHGCINLSPYDSLYLFNQTSPLLPDGWHGVQVAPNEVGTAVHIRVF